MAAAKVVMGEMQGDGRAVVFQLFAKPVRQTGEPAHGHAERQVLPLDMGSADLRRVGIAADWDYLTRARNFWRRSRDPLAARSP